MKAHGYDFLIAGAGPAGLSAAITAGRLGAKCLLIEKGRVPGPEPRGESIAPYPFMDELLGTGWLKENSLNDPAYRRFHSPGDRKNTLIDVHKPYYFFPWRTLIDHMTALAMETGAEILLESEVLEVIEEDSRCTGLRYRGSDESIHEVFGTTVLGCMGHGDSLGQAFGIDRGEIDCPTMKFYSGKAPAVRLADHPYLQFYMIQRGMVSCAPDLPPVAAYVFPLRDGEMEAGLMLRLGAFRGLKGVTIPDEQKMREVWSELTQSYPGFSSFFRGAETTYIKPTVISNRTLFEDVIPHRKGGLIFLGDTIGFSEANGSSGLYFGMAQAAFWVTSLLETAGPGENPWGREPKERLLSAYRQWDVYKYIRKSYRDIVLAENLMFKILGTDRRLNRWWKPAMALLQMTS